MKNKKIYIIPLLILLLLSFWTTLALASGDQSSTPGIPGQKPLSFVGAYLTNGSNTQNAVNVPLSSTTVSVDGNAINYLVKLSFDKNVVNSLVWGGNSQCFSMYNSNNQSIPIKVIKIDDTIDFNQRQNVFVGPVNPLCPGTTYHIFVSPNLLAKNQYSTLGGTTGGQGVTISFRTEGQASQPSAPATNNAPSTSTQSNTINSPSKSSASTPVANVSETKDPGNQKTTETGSKGTNKKSNNKSLNKAAIAKTLNNADDEAGSNNNWIVYVGLVLLATWLAVEVYLKKKKINLLSKASNFTKNIFRRR